MPYTPSCHRCRDFRYFISFMMPPLIIFQRRRCAQRYDSTECCLCDMRHTAAAVITAPLAHVILIDVASHVCALMFSSALSPYYLFRYDIGFSLFRHTPSFRHILRAFMSRRGTKNNTTVWHNGQHNARHEGNLRHAASSVPPLPFSILRFSSIFRHAPPSFFAFR